MPTLNETLTGLANAIRNKAGTTAPMTLESMISAVNGISVGDSGGLPTGIRKLDCGEIVFASSINAYDYRISHALGEVPDFAVVFMNTSLTPSSSSTNYVLLLSTWTTPPELANNVVVSGLGVRSGTYMGKKTTSAKSNYATESDFGVYASLATSSESGATSYAFRFYGSARYTWIVGCYE